MADKLRVSTGDISNYELSDSDDFSSEKEFLQSIDQKKRVASDSEEEVYAFSDSDNEKDDFEMADSDVEGQEESNDNLPDSKAWGKKKHAYYSTDYVDQDYGGFGDDEEAALMEEEEAKNIQNRLLKQLTEEDFSLEFFTRDKILDKEAITDTIVKTDLSQLSKREKLELFERESPEFSGLVEDFKKKLTVAKDDLKPVLNLVKDGTLPNCTASKFVKTNYDLILNYCMNISFYLLLKSKRMSIQNHPVIKRLYQYRQMLNQMEPVYEEVIKPQIETIKSAISKNDSKILIKGYNKRKNDNICEVTRKKLKLVSSLEKVDGNDTGVSDNEDEYEGKDYFDKSQQEQSQESEESGFSDNDVEEDIPNNDDKTDHIIEKDEIGNKRKITYQIAKNKGLTPHRKKEQRNPRVKHKRKFKKAKIRRKGMVREVRKELNRYGGESSGIKSNVKKSIKIK